MSNYAAKIFSHLIKKQSQNKKTTFFSALAAEWDCYFYDASGLEILPTMFIYAAAQVLRILHVSFLLSRHVLPSHSFNFTLIFMNTCKDKQTAFPAGNYMFKVSNRNNRTRWEICQKLTIKTAERETLNASLWCLYC